MGNVRMKQTLTQFYSSGGTSKFSDRIASALGIHPSRVKVVAVYEGSVVVEYAVEAEEEVAETQQLSQVTQLTKTLTNLFTSGTAASILGAPVLEAGITPSIGAAVSSGGGGASSAVVLVAATDTESATSAS